MFIVRLLLFVPMLVVLLVGVTISLVLWVFIGKQIHSLDLPFEDIFEWLMGLGE